MADGKSPVTATKPEKTTITPMTRPTMKTRAAASPIVVLAIIALIVVFAGVVFLAYKQGLKQGAQGNPPVIRADGTPSKVAPANPGGLEIPHQDRAIYDRMSGSGEPTPPDTEHLLPKPEEPMAMREPASAASVAPDTATPPPTQAPVQAAPVAPVEMTPSTSPAEPPAASAVTETPPAATTGPGGYVAQLASFRDEPSARAELKKLQKKFPSLMGLSADIQKADLGAKGIYYRLRAGYLHKAGAQTLCTELKARGQACLVRPK